MLIRSRRLSDLSTCCVTRRCSACLAAEQFLALKQAKKTPQQGGVQPRPAAPRGGLQHRGWLSTTRCSGHLPGGAGRWPAHFQKLRFCAWRSQRQRFARFLQNAEIVGAMQKRKNFVFLQLWKFPWNFHSRKNSFFLRKNGIFKYCLFCTLWKKGMSIIKFLGGGAKNLLPTPGNRKFFLKNLR